MSRLILQSLPVIAGVAAGAMLLMLLPEIAGADTEPQAAQEWPWAAYGIPPSTLATCIPTERTDWASSYHTAMLQREPREAVQVIFLGDSITMMWRSQSGYEGGTPVWDEYYAPLPAANLGISGDKTEHILWRITGGHDLDGLSPKVLVLLIGINNLLQGSTPEDTAAGITTIVNYLRTKLPQTRILLLGVFPCWEKADDPIRERVRRTNAIIRPLADRERVFYLDIGDKFLEPDGSIKVEKLRDLLHLSEFGYRIWAEAMQGRLKDLLENEGRGDIWGPAQVNEGD
jgi:beta-glucosidase